MNRKDADTARRLQADPAGRAIEEAQQRIAAKLAARASQAATATNGPGDDHGAGAGQDKPAGGRTEPRIPEEIHEIARAAFAGRPPMADGVYALPSERNPWRALEDALAAAIPAIRAAIADEIEAAVPVCTILSSSQVVHRAQGMNKAARIARGGDQ